MSHHAINRRVAHEGLRFPPNDRGSGEVVIYRMSKEEMRGRYGTPLQDRISRDELFRMRKSGMDNHDIAQKYGVKPEGIRELFNYYRKKEKLSREKPYGLPRENS